MITERAQQIEHLSWLYSTAANTAGAGQLADELRDELATVWRREGLPFEMMTVQISRRKK